jgi:hypothetical protein
MLVKLFQKDAPKGVPRSAMHPNQFPDFAVAVHISVMMKPFHGMILLIFMIFMIFMFRYIFMSGTSELILIILGQQIEFCCPIFLPTWPRQQVFPRELCPGQSARQTRRAIGHGPWLGP